MKKTSNRQRKKPLKKIALYRGHGILPLGCGGHYVVVQGEVIGVNGSGYTFRFDGVNYDLDVTLFDDTEYGALLKLNLLLVENLKRTADRLIAYRDMA